jgi:uncharacterized protein YkuJ
MNDGFGGSMIIILYYQINNIITIKVIKQKHEFHFDSTSLSNI